MSSSMSYASLNEELPQTEREMMDYLERMTTTTHESLKTAYTDVYDRLKLRAAHLEETIEEATTSDMKNNNNNNNNSN